MSVEDEYERLVSKVSKAENVGNPAVKLALCEVLDDRYGGVPSALRYKAFTELSEKEVEKAKRYLSVIMESARFKGEFPAISAIIFD